jgi:hypothetical protein
MGGRPEGDTTMTDEQKVRSIRELPRAAEELTPEEAQEAQGGAQATGGTGTGKVSVSDIQVSKLNDCSSVL